MSEPSTNPSHDEPNPLGYLAVGLAWLIPGAGHVALGQWARGLVFAVALHTLFAAGLLIGGLRALNPGDQPIWGYAQFIAGWPMLAGNAVLKQHPEAPAASGKVQEIGTVYCGVAGMLNMLLMFDVLMRASGATALEAAKAKTAPGAPPKP